MGGVKKPKTRSWEGIQESPLPFLCLLTNLHLKENTTEKDNPNPSRVFLAALGDGPSWA